MTSLKLFHNGKIFTSVGDDRLQAAMLIEDGAVVYVGEEAAVRAESEAVGISPAASTVI
jgi:predicted amidohydrolase YtcJ